MKKTQRRVFAHFLALVMTLSCLTLFAGGTVTVSADAGASVYDPSAGKSLPTLTDGYRYTITTANQFMAIMDALNSGTNFDGKEIVLDCDIVINQGSYPWASPISWSGNANAWGNRFSGAFYGQGHYISGIYNINSNNAGLFGRVNGNTVFQNFTIKNSYFKSTAGSTGDGIGGVLGCVDPGWNGAKATTTTINNVHVESTIIETTGASTGVGGIVGVSTRNDNFATSTLIIQNSSFQGTINAPQSSYVGGIIGHMHLGQTLVLENCVSDATITCANESAGLIGRIERCHAMISNCFARGSITAKTVCTNNNTYYRTSALIGFILSDSENITVQISNALAAVSCNSAEALIATMKGSSNSYTVSFELKNIIRDSTVQASWSGLIRRDNSNSLQAKVNNSSTVQGSNWNLEGQISSSYFNTSAQASTALKGKKVFEYWSVVAGDYPVPPTASVPDIYNGTASTAYISFDYSFTDSGVTETENSVTIYTAEQLMGFASASLSNNFSGKTVKLARDIIINRGNASNWASSAPSYNWECSSSWGNRFAGTFDGQGHTVSGVYSSLAKHTGLFQCVALGSTIQNLNLVNSYFQGTGDGRWVGALIGYMDTAVAGSTSTISNVSVSAIVKGTERAGGLIGSDSNNVRTTTTNITNCTFNGTVFSRDSKAGGIIGQIRSNKNFTGCTVNGTIFSNGSYVGGLVGYAYDDSGNGSIVLTATNCNAKVTLSGTEQIGGLIGRVDRGKSVTVSNCLAQSDITASHASPTTIAGVIGYWSTSSGIAGTASISNTLIAAKGAKLTAYGVTHWGNATLTLTYSDVKVDSTIYNGTARQTYSSASSYLSSSGSITTATSASLKGVAVFASGWTAVSGDYPVPTEAATIDSVKIRAYENYGNAVTVLGYQTKQSGGKYSLRLIATLSNELASNYTIVGFDDVVITLSDGTTRTVDKWYCSYIYKSVKGGGATYAASEYLSEYIFCLSIENAPSPVVSVVAEPIAMVNGSSAVVYGPIQTYSGITY